MSNGLVLSGGGAKGSFEAGVLDYLYRFGYSPDIITSTSVGSINGLKLCEGEGGSAQGFQGLKSIWLNMNQNTDMYDSEGWVKGLADWIKNVLDQQDADLMRGIPTIMQDIVLVLVPGVAADYLDDLQKLGDALKSGANKSLYHLEPVRKIAEKTLNYQLIASSGIKLRMAVVCLESGALQYVSEWGRLMDDPARSGSDPAYNQVDLIDAMLGSAAIPGVFRPQRLAGNWYVDGGTREVVPLRAAVDMGATDVIAVVAPLPLQPDKSYDSRPALDFANRAIDILSDEIIIGDLYPRGGWNARVLVVRPDVEVESSRTIDPGLIRMNMAYGYMIAFDTLEQLSPRFRVSLRNLSNRMASTRLNIWNIENNIASTIQQQKLGLLQRDSVDQLRAAFADLRYKKGVLRGMIEYRLQVAGLVSMPPEAFTSWDTWEQHGPTVALPDSPWDSLSFDTYYTNFQNVPPSVEYYYTVSVESSELTLTPYTQGSLVWDKSSSASGTYIQSLFAPPGPGAPVACLLRSGKIEVYSPLNTGRGWFLTDSLPTPDPGSGGRIGVIPRFPTSVSAFAAYEGILPGEPNEEPIHLEAIVHFEAVLDLPEPVDYLGMYTRDGEGWHGPSPIKVDGEMLDGVTGKPCLIQGNWGWLGNFELIVIRRGRLEHYYRDNDAPNRPWHRLPDLPLPVTGSDPNGIHQQVPVTPVSVTFFQSSWPETFFPHGNLEVLVQFDSLLPDVIPGYLAMYYRDAKSGTWFGPYPIKVGGELLSGVSSPPTILQDNVDRNVNGVGNFEMLVIRNGRIEHLSRYNGNTLNQWSKKGELPLPKMGASKSGGVIGIPAFPDSVSMFQEFPTKDLRALVHFSRIITTPGENSDFLLTYTYSEAEMKWQTPVTLMVGGNVLDGVDKY